MQRLLIANRGEIARRIIRTARTMGIETVAVYSDADRDALHVREADHAVAIGAAPALSSYLSIEALLAAAAATGADALHPGYGFLSENPALARACAAAGITFVGPSPDAIEAMGSKRRAREIAVAAGLPVVPGHHDDESGDEALLGAAAAIGWPVLIKAVAGGGGRGMRVARDAGAFPEALAAARREAHAAFGNDRVLLERYLERPRHVEVQVFGDRHGRVVALGDRDCSLQRRYQKVIEEAPAPGLGAAMRAAMADAAVRVAAAVGYCGAGTVELIVEGDEFWFMEMNTRLQVEHPVTEQVTGLDLVRLQIEVARGGRVPDPPAVVGHAIEARVCAEVPGRGFLPSAGALARCDWPAGAGIRVDAAVAQGCTVGTHYDSMIGKVIATGRDREDARQRLLGALAGVAIAGIDTNVEFLQRLLRLDAFVAVRHVNTTIDSHLDVLTAPAVQPADLPCAIAARVALRTAGAACPAMPWPSPWAGTDAFRANLPALETMRFDLAGDAVVVRLEHCAGGVDWLQDDGGRRRIAWRRTGDALVVACDAQQWRCRALPRADGIDLFIGGRHMLLRDPSAVAATGGDAFATGDVRAPLPGEVIVVGVREGDRVATGDLLVVVEAMKMEHSLRAPLDGRVTRVACIPGQRVAEGDELVRVEADPDA